MPETPETQEQRLDLRRQLDAKSRLYEIDTSEAATIAIDWHIQLVEPYERLILKLWNGHDLDKSDMVVLGQALVSLDGVNQDLMNAE